MNQTAIESSPVAGVAAIAPDERFLTRREVELRVGLKKSAIYARMKEDKFPKPIPDDETHSVWWLKSEIDAYMLKKVRRARE